MLNHVTKVWVTWILAVSQLGFAVGSDWLHQISHHLSHHHLSDSQCSHEHGASDSCHGPRGSDGEAETVHTCHCDHAVTEDAGSSNAGPSNAGVPEAGMDQPLTVNSAPNTTVASAMANRVDAVVDTGSQPNAAVSNCCRPVQQPADNDGRCWTAHYEYHLCFSNDCSFVQFSKQCGLQGELNQAFLEFLSVTIAQELKSQRFSLGTLKTISSRGPPTWLG